MLTTRRHSRRTAGTALVVAALMLLLAAPAGAQGPPQTGSGTGTGVVTDIEEGDKIVLGRSGNWRQTRTLTGFVNEGPLAGEFVQTVTGVVRTDANFVTFHGTMDFTGTIDGCDGEHKITLGVTGRGQANPPVTEASVHVIDSSSGHVTGRGTVSQFPPEQLPTEVGDPISLLTYDIQYICR